MYDVSVTYVPQRMALIAKRRILAEQAGTVIPATFAELFEHIDSGGACGAEETLVIFPQDFGDPGEHEIAVVVTIAASAAGAADRTSGALSASTRRSVTRRIESAWWAAVRSSVPRPR